MFENQERPIISKSRYLSGLQCPKLIWYQFNEPDTIPPPDADKLAVFDQGHRVGEFEDVPYLVENKDDPRPGFLNALVEAVGPEGSIVVYNAPLVVFRSVTGQP